MARALHLVLASAFLSGISAEAQSPRHPVAGPNLVRSAFPQWTLQRADAESCGSASRAIASGDFNGDRVADHVARLARGERGIIVALVSRRRGFSHIILERASRREIMHMFLGVERRGSRHLVIVGDRDRRPMILRHDAPTSGTCEASSFIYLIEGSRFTRAFTSD